MLLALVGVLLGLPRPAVAATPPFLTVSVGGAVGAVLKADGTVWTYGNGTTGVLGNGTTTNPQLTPVRAEVSAGVPLDRVVQLAGGYGHLCALRADGTVWCWGDNGEGRLGNGSTTNSSRPTRVETAAGVALTGVVQLQLGLDYSSALKADGTVWSWGRNTDGQLGDGTLTNRSRPVQATNASDSSPVTGVTWIGGGWAHNTVLRRDGTVWAWGANVDGQLGDGSTTRRPQAVQSQLASGGPLVDMVQVSSIGHHTIGLRADGTVWTWGDNAYGQLSDGTLTDRTRAVAAVAASGAAVRASSVYGSQYNVYWVQQDGTAYAAGYGGWYSNGDGTTTSRSQAVQVQDSSGSPLTRIVRIDGVHGGVAVRADGTVWSWGYNPDGRSGTGATGDIPRAVQAAANRGAGWQAMTGGSSHTVGIRTDGTAWSWGANSSGQLGIGATGIGVDGPPVQVLGPGGAPLTEIVEVAAGSDHTLALRGDGTVWAWGAGGSGQLGDGSTVAAATQAVQVTDAAGAALVGARAIAAGGNSSYALLANGAVVAWGAGAGGQLASGGTADLTRATTAKAAGGSPLSMVAAVAAGRAAGVDGFALFLLAGGTTWASGSNASGQLGDGTTTQRLEAVQVVDGAGQPLAGIAAIAAGGASSYARRSNGTALAWGSNASGRLGDGTTAGRLAPGPVQSDGGSTLSGVAALEAGASHAVALVAGGGLWAWGAGGSGQLADGTSADRLRAVPMVTGSGASVQGARLSTGVRHGGALVFDPGATSPAVQALLAGDDASGQVGDCGRGGTVPSLVPIATTCPSPVNDGAGADVDGQVSVTTLVANWDGHVDQTLLRYEYCMSTATDASGCAGTVLVGWTDNGTATSVTRSGLALAVNSVYYTCARTVRPAATLAATCSDGVRVDDTAPDVPTLVSPADGASVASTALTASYSDTYTSGVIEAQACSDAACTSVAATARSSVVASGTNGTASPTLARGTYYWRARAIDASGLASGWSSTWSFAYNAIPVATAVSPDSGTWVSTRHPSLTVRHDDADGGAGTVTVELCATAPADPWSTSCTSGYQAVRSGDLAVASGSSIAMTPNAPLADGDWSWRARSVDELPAASAWTGVRTVRVDGTAPAPLPEVSLVRKGAGRIDINWTASTDAGVGGVRYEVERYQTGTSSWSSVCTTTSLSCTQTGLGGAEILVVRVRACDSLGNCSAWSGSSGVANSGYLLRNTASTNLGNTQSRAAILPPGGTLDSSSTGVRLPGGNSSGRVGYFPLRYGVAANSSSITMDVTAPIDPQDTVSGWGWVIDDVEAKALSAGAMEAVITTEAVAGTGGGTGRIVCRLWRAVTNGSTSLSSWQHLADADGSVADVMTPSTAGPVTSTCDLSAALSDQLTFANDEVLYVELLLHASVAGASGDQYMLRFNDASSAINMPQPGTPPSAPTPVSPIGGVLVGEQPTLTASYSHPAAADGSLEFQFSTDSTFATGVTNVASPPVASGSTGAVSIGPLALGQSWYWRVRARDTAGLTSAWSSNQSFRTSARPAAPIPSSPADGAALSSGAVVLSAGAFSDPDGASDSHGASQWQVAAAGSDWSTVVADSGVTTADLLSWTTPGLGQGEWQWRVRYRDAYGIWSAWSSVASPRSFTIAPSSSTISLSAAGVGLGIVQGESDNVGTITATVGTSEANGYSLVVTDQSDSASLSCGCGGNVADWTGTDATPSSWAAGTAGYGGVTVRDAPGGRLAKWGPGTATAEDDHAANLYAGLRSTSNVKLHSTVAPSSGDAVVVTYRVNAAAVTLAGSYSSTVTFSVLANP